MSAAVAELLGSHVLDVREIAQVMGVSSRTVRRWTASSSAPPQEINDRLREFKAFVDEIRIAVRDEPARHRQRSPNPDLDWRKPLDLIAEGEYRRVIASILALAEGVTA